MNEIKLKEIEMPNINATFRLYDTNRYGEKEITITGRDTKTTIRFRNVGERNKESAIQFSIEEYNKSTNRTKSVSFSVPLEAADIFLEHISKPS